MKTRKWDERRWVFEQETLYLAMKYVIFFLGKATATKPLFELLLKAATNPESSSGTLSTISNIEISARHRLNSRINMIFPIGQRTTMSVEMVTTAMCEYVSKVCLFLKSLLSGILTLSLSPKTSRHVSASSHKIKHHSEWPFLLYSQ
jgi:hypothetical protein